MSVTPTVENFRFDLNIQVNPFTRRDMLTRKQAKAGLEALDTFGLEENAPLSDNQIVKIRDTITSTHVETAPRKWSKRIRTEQGLPLKDTQPGDDNTKGEESNTSTGSRKAHAPKAKGKNTQWRAKQQPMGSVDTSHIQSPTRKALLDRFSYFLEKYSVSRNTLAQLYNGEFLEKGEDPVTRNAFISALSRDDVGVLYPRLTEFFTQPKRFIDAMEKIGHPMEENDCASFIAEMPKLYQEDVAVMAALPAPTLHYEIPEKLEDGARRALLEKTRAILVGPDINWSMIHDAYLDAYKGKVAPCTETALKQSFNSFRASYSTNIPKRIQYILSNPDPFLDQLAERGVELTKEMRNAFKEGLPELLIRDRIDHGDTDPRKIAFTR